jgi:hypothetical protein
LARKKIKSFVTLVTVFTPPVGQFFAAGSPDSQKGFPMTKLIILAALGFGVVGLARFPPNGLPHSRVPKQSA